MRYILPSEGARAQSLPEHIKLPETKAASFRVLGNMVNIELVYSVASQLLTNYHNGHIKTNTDKFQEV
jgi:site-specific DNA-cytosine methylase